MARGLWKKLAGLIESEVFFVPGIDLVADAQVLPFQDQTLRGIVMVDVLHHVRDVEQFLSKQLVVFCLGAKW